jgi:NADH dehydrogenase FAD-containing subunit
MSDQATAGVQASPLGRMVAEAAGAEVDRAGRVRVRPDCTVPGHPEVFVVGDLMSLDRLPGLAQVAIQAGRHAATTIALRLRGDTSERPFHYRDKGTMATIARFQAIASIGRIRVSGFAAWVMWLGVHLFALTGSAPSPHSRCSAAKRSSRKQPSSAPRGPRERRPWWVTAPGEARLGRCVSHPRDRPSD